MSIRKILRIYPAKSHLQDIFSKELKISKILAQVLINRGISSAEDAHSFLNAGLKQLYDPFTFSDMHKAVGLISKAAVKKEKVMVFSDYDVDGITSLAVLKTTLSKMGLDVAHYLPHRIKEGYGLNKNILSILRQKNIALLITADCGTNNCEQIKELRRHNIEVIVTDHHEPAGENTTSYASAAINAKLKGCNYKYKDLAGVGVAYKLCQALTGETLFDDLDLVSLGTIADVAPLTGENRIIVKEGLARLSKTKRIGLKALIEKSGIKNKVISSKFVSYILGPRINASGRVDSAEASFNLLMSRKKEEADGLADMLEKYNRQRQKIEGGIMQEAQDLIDKEVNFKEQKVIVVAKEGWHQGVIGITASKLADKFYRPVIVISKTNRLCKGSGRSIKNFHLFNVLLECKEFLEEFGGHSHAVGLVITDDNIELFKNKINSLAQEKILFQDLFPSLEVDMELSLSDLNESMISELDALAPFGAGNAEPLFYTQNLKLRGPAQILGKDTIKFWVTDGNITYQAIGFGMGSSRDRLLEANYFGMVYSPRMDTWQGEEGIILEISEMIFQQPNF